MTLSFTPFRSDDATGMSSSLALEENAPLPAASPSVTTSSFATPTYSQSGSSNTAPGRTNPRGRLPWLILGAGVLLGGMTSWFAWQFRQLTSPSTPLQVMRSPAPGAAPVPRHDTATAPVASISPNSQAASTPAASAPMPPGRRKATQTRTASTQPHPGQASRDALATAWRAYRQGDLPLAARHYRQLLQQDPHNRDATLGLAAASAHLGDKALALNLYLRRLTDNPQDEAAHAGLLLLEPQKLDQQTEIRLLEAGSDTAARVLAGHYASQQRWQEARQQYALARRRSPNDADVTFNLAVSLDHLQQHQEAAHYYRRALALKGGRFSQPVAAQRLNELEAVRP